MATKRELVVPNDYVAISSTSQLTKEHVLLAQPNSLHGPYKLLDILSS